MPCLIRGLLLHSDLKNSRPEFAGDVKLIVCLIVSNAIQHGFRILKLAFGHQAVHIDPRRYVATLRIDRRDPVVVPDVCINLALHKLELVQFPNRRLTAVKHVDRSSDVKIRWVEKSEPVRTIAQDQRLSIRRNPPTLAVYLNSPRRSKLCAS